MKVQCDVCTVEAASVFCCADEAALCDGCDRRIHGANKLAGKHRRLPLLHPSPQSPPLCDICQERRGLLFCQEDRAILCRDCDVPIHTANDLTMNHSRFLLTSVRLSSTPLLPSAPPPEAEFVDNGSDGRDVGIKNYRSKSREEAVVVAAEEAAACSSSSTTTVAADGSNGSSISEYLIKMLPGWHVEDFLTDDAATAADADALSLVNGDLLNGSGGLMCGVDEGPPFGVPQAKHPAAGGLAGPLFEGLVGSKASQQRWGEGPLRVPRMHSNKRCRTTVRYS